ncbi:trypsin-like peptidase domain-containing protein [Mesorhizobium sp. KR9-304]|uniref:trypsin-like peptidase domain-containing protein n=1 Tax=Mesorhizobium sp. KR9-304 TaxID=3156614 RepID=UPI0032B50574
MRVTLVSTGQSRIFSPQSSEILIGRDGSWASFVLPSNEKRAGRRHLQLKRQAGGDWEVARLADYYVEVNGRPTMAQARLRDGDLITLGGPDGPTLRFELLPPDGATGPDPDVTDFQAPVPALEIALERLKRNATLVASVLGAVVLVTGYLWVTVDEHTSRLQSVSNELTSREERALDQPSAWRGQADRLQKAVHLVVVRQNGVERGVATAWPITPTRLVTNAHVAAQIAGRRDLEIIVRSPGAAPRDFTVAAVTIHAGYEPFSRYLREHKAGTKTADGAFKQVKLPSAYDLAILELAPGSDAGPVLELAPPGSAAAGDQIAFAGYFLRDIEGNENAHRFPTPRVHFGNVSAVTNFFLFPPEDTADGRLIHNTIPLTGGTSGGPVIDQQGRVVGIISSGTVVPLPADSEASDQKVTKVPSAAMVNYAQEAGLVRDLLDGSSFDMEAERAGWQRELGKFDDHRQYVLNRFLDELAKRGEFVAVKDPQVQPVNRSLDARSLPIRLDGGHSYAVLAYSHGAGPVWLRVNAQGQEIASDNADAAKAVFDAKASGEAELLLVTSSEEPSSVELFVYRSK